MDKLTATLLTGAAMGALSVVPAMAGSTHGPVLGLKAPGHAPTNSKSFGLLIKSAHGMVVLPGGLHGKSTNVNPKTNKVTYTDTLADYSYTEPRATWYHVSQDIKNGEVWYSETETYSTVGSVFQYHIKVFDTPGQVAKGSKDANAKITIHNNTTLKQHFTYTYKTTSGRTYEKVYYSTNLTYYGPNYKLENNTISSDNFQVNDLNKYTTTFTNSCGKHVTKYKGTARLNFAMHFD